MTSDIAYSQWARYYDALYAFKDYEADCRRFTDLIREHHPQARTLLDVACGTGKHLEILQRDFAVEGLDANAGFLEAARARIPGLATHHARMEAFDLGRTYDVVTCLFSSIGFMRTREMLAAAMANFHRHLRPGGLLLVEPWFSAEIFWTGTINAHFVDQPGLKLAMMYTTAVRDGMSVLSNRIMVGTPEGIETVDEEHVLGLYTCEQYRATIADAGFELLLSLDPQPEWKRGVHLARKRA
jgi:SAM-dependent methyltransferase